MKYPTFGGIVDSGSHATLVDMESLVNFRHIPSKDGTSLINSYGIKYIENVDGDISAFQYADFGDFISLISIGDKGIRVKNAIFGGIGTDNDKVYNDYLDIFSPRGNPNFALAVSASGKVVFSSIIFSDKRGTGKINGNGTNQVTGIGTRFTIELQAGCKVKYNVNLGTGSQWLEFTVVSIEDDTHLTSDISIDTTHTFRPFPAAFLFRPVTFGNIQSGDYFRVSQTGIELKTWTFGLDVAIGTDIFTSILNLVSAINASNLYIKASYNPEDTIGVNDILVRAITPGISGNLLEISTNTNRMVVSASTLLGGLDQQYLCSIISIVGNTISITVGASPTNGYYKYSIVRNISKNKYAVITAVNSEFPNNPSLTLSKNVQTDGWSSGDSIIIYRTDYLATVVDYYNSRNFEFNTIGNPRFTNLSSNHELAVGGVLTFEGYPIWIGRIKDRSYFNNAFSFNGIYGTTMMDPLTRGSFIKDSHSIWLNSGPVTPLVQDRENYNVFEFSYSLKLDGYNETGILNDDPYGVGQTQINTFTNTNVAAFADLDASGTATDDAQLINGPDGRDFGETRGGYPKNKLATRDTVVVVRIIVSNPEVLNRRITHLCLYSRQVIVSDQRQSQSNLIVSSKGVWRKIVDIDINSDKWTSNGTGGYYHDQFVTSGMLTGQMYSDRLGYSPKESLMQRSYFQITANQRLFVVSDDSRNSIHYSPINSNGYSLSVVPDSNFILFNKEPGDIVGLASISGKLIVWKKNVTISYTLEGLPNYGKEDYISTSSGLASSRSIAECNRLLYYVSYQGIQSTDGFKSRIENVQWIRKFLSYSIEDIEDSLGFYDKVTNSYYIIIGSDVWVLDLITNLWRQEYILYNTEGLIYGIPTVIGKNLNGDSFLYCKNESHIYEFPRHDLLHRHTYNTKMLGIVDITMYSHFKTIETIGGEGLDSLFYINNAYIDSSGLESSNAIIAIYRGSTLIKAVTIFDSKRVFPFTTRSPMDKFSLSFSVSSTDEIILREVGFKTMAMTRVGSQLKGAV